MHDTATLHRLDQIVWTIVATVAAIVLVSPLVSNFYLEPRGFATPAGASALLLIGGGFYRTWRKDPHLASGLSCTAQITAFSAVAAPLSYLAASANMPLQDHAFAAIDSAMGLDWRALLAWMNVHTTTYNILKLAYVSLMLQAIITILVLSYCGQLLRLRTFMLAFAMSALLCIAISAILPAHGTWGFYEITEADISTISPVTLGVQQPIMDGLRDGSLRALNAANAEGIITFPSFHAALGVLFMVALWPVPYVRWAAIALNVLLIVATPIDGGHYFVDVPAGIAIVLLALHLARATIGWVRPQSSARMAREPVALTSR